MSTTRTGGTCSTHIRPASRSMLHLPPAVLELVLQYLEVAEQLNHCTHLCRRFPPPSATSIRHSPLLLTDDSVRRIWQQPRLLALLSAATSVLLHIDAAPLASSAARFVSRAAAVGSVFPSLRSLSWKLSSAALYKVEQQFRRVAADARGGLQQSPFSASPLLSALSARSATLRSLRIELPTLGSLDVAVVSLLDPLASLRRLCIAARLWTDDMLPLLNTPLDVLDLSGSTLFQGAGDFEPPLHSVAGSALLHCCRVLRLPRTALHLPPAWLAYLDAIVTERTSSSRPHTLSVQHELSAAAVAHLMRSPPCCSLSVAVEGRDALWAAVMPRWLYSVDGVVPRQLQLSVQCHDWNTSARCFVFFAQGYHHNIRSISLTELPSMAQVVSRLLMAVSHCSKLETLCLSATSDRPQWPDLPATELQWAEQPLLSKLHTLTLAGLDGAEEDVCRLLSCSPSLRTCTLDFHGLSTGTLRKLSSSCLLLTHLRLRLTAVDAPAASTSVCEGLPWWLTWTAVPFRSLERCDLLAHRSNSARCSPLRVAALCNELRWSPLAGSPLQELTVELWNSFAPHQPAFAALLDQLPALETLRVKMPGCRWPDAPPSSCTAWEHGADDDEGAAEERRPPVHRQRRLATRRSAPPAWYYTVSPIDSLESVVSTARLPVEHFAAVLAHCPALTSVKLTIYDADGLLTFLHCLAHIGRHCPLIERITYSLDFSSLSATHHNRDRRRVLTLEDVVPVVAQHNLPKHAFRSLLCVSDVGSVLHVMSAEAARHVKRCWMRQTQASVRLPLPASTGE